MNKSINVLLVEDNLAIAKQVVGFLEGLKWQVDFAATGQQGIDLALSQQVDVIILDLNLPDMDGLDVCQHIKQHATRVTPVLMLTARDAFTDKAKGFGQGADDYLTKPFDFRELALRVEALARRPQLHTNTQVSEGHLTLDTRAKTVQWQQQPVTVTGVGFSILQKLLMEYPYPVSRSDLITHIWGDEPPESNALKSHMYSLRKALEKASGQPLLATISNIGYKLTGLDHEA